VAWCCCCLLVRLRVVLLLVCCKVCAAADCWDVDLGLAADSPAGQATTRFENGVMCTVNMLWPTCGCQSLGLEMSAHMRSF
jgi:hypothetical protein